VEFARFHVISMFLHNFAEFGTGTGYWEFGKETNTAYFGQVQAAVEY